MRTINDMWDELVENNPTFKDDEASRQVFFAGAKAVLMLCHEAAIENNPVAVIELDREVTEEICRVHQSAH
jgi:hypothetical protein